MFEVSDKFSVIAPQIAAPSMEIELTILASKLDQKGFNWSLKFGQLTTK